MLRELTEATGRWNASNERRVGVRKLEVVAGLAMLLWSATGVSAEVAPVGLSLFLPVVLEAPGRDGAWYSTELTLTNAGSTPARVVLSYRAIDAIGAKGSGSVEETLPAGRQSVIPALIPYLREHGIPIPESGAQGGTLRVRFEGLSSAAAGGAYARTTTPSGPGRAGVGYRAIDVGQPYPVYYVIGLQETDADRSNLGLANADETAPVTLRVKLFRGSDGTATVLPDVTLPPGGWAQLDSVLGRIGTEQGYARVERVSGSGPFVAYGVLNDNATGDGSFVEGRRALYDPDLFSPVFDQHFVAVVMQSTTTRSELAYVNYVNYPRMRLRYRESLSVVPKPEQVATLLLQKGGQLILPSVFDDLGAPANVDPPESRAGKLSCLPDCYGVPCGDSTTLAHARVLIEAVDGAGRFGVVVPVVADYARREAWVLALRENATTRSNIAVTNVFPGGFPSDPLHLRVEVFDGDTGLVAGALDLPVVPGDGWFQINSPLRRFGVAQGYVRVSALTPRPFYAYGVINDGASPGEGTGDASVVPMTIEE